MDFLNDKRFAGIKPFEKKVWLSSPTMHGDEQKWVDEAIQTNWVSTVGANINEVERQMAEYIGVKYAVGLSCGTSALHLAIYPNPLFSCKSKIISKFKKFKAQSLTDLYMKKGGSY